MCHLLLFLPVVALPVLWLLPLSISVPAYALVVSVALWIYVLAVKSGRRPAMTGAEGMIGECGRVVQVDGSTAKLLVHGELWSAETAGEKLAVGAEVRVVGIEGLRLKVTADGGLHAP